MVRRTHVSGKGGAWSFKNEREITCGLDQNWSFINRNIYIKS